MSRMLPLKPPPALPPRNDPFRYSWRYVLRGTGADGNEVWDQVPLTLDGLLHPEAGDFIAHGTAHARERARTAAEARAADLAARLRELEERVNQATATASERKPRQP